MSRAPDYTPILVATGDDRFVCQAWHQGTPHPKDRPRLSTKGGTPRLYTPSETVTAERGVRATLEEAMGSLRPLDCPLLVELVFVMPPPVAHGRLPDTDNLIKLVLDAAHDVVYRNDRSVEGVVGLRRVRPAPEAGTLILVGRS